MRPLCEYCLPPRRVATLTAWQGCDEVYVCEEHTPNRGNDMTLATLPVAIDAALAAAIRAYTLGSRPKGRASSPKEVQP